MNLNDGSTSVEQRILVISDLHMTGGRSSDTGTWSPTEDFFQDEEFALFLAHYCREGRTTTLVINGDLFDFLQVIEFPRQWWRDRGKDEQGRDRPKGYIYSETSPWGGQFQYDIPLSDINPTYGLRCTMEATRFLTGRIIEGHERFFRALVEFVACNGNRVVILKGNHDVQLFWQEVQDEILARLRYIAAHRMPDGRPVDFAADRVIFKPWFHYVPGLVWIEHGNQYEYTTSFMNFLHPTLPFAYDETGGERKRVSRSDKTGEKPSAAAAHIELDFSSFLVRYLTNPGEPLNPLADNIRPLTRYWEGMWRDHPFFVLGTVRAGLVLILKAFAKSSTMRLKTGWSSRTMSEENRELMGAQVVEPRVTFPVLDELDQCKEEPVMAHGPLRVLWWFFRPMIVGVLWLIPLFFVTANVGRWISDPSPDAPWYLPTLIIALRGLIVIGAGAVLLWISQYYRRVQSWRRRREALAERKKARSVKPPGSGKPDPALRPRLVRSTVHDLRTMAAYIAGLVDVPYVTFGHTHYVDLYNLDDDVKGMWTERSGSTTVRRYFNTGTWMSIFEPREQLFREARQLTFLEIVRESDGSSRADLHCWYPPQSAPRSVVVVNMEEPDNSVENGILMSTIRGLGGLSGKSE